MTLWFPVGKNLKNGLIGEIGLNKKKNLKSLKDIFKKLKKIPKVNVKFFF